MAYKFRKRISILFNILQSKVQRMKNKKYGQLQSYWFAENVLWLETWKKTTKHSHKKDS